MNRMNTITASLGGWLTQRSYVPTEERILVKQVSGFGDLETLYREATDDEIAEVRARERAEQNESNQISNII